MFVLGAPHGRSGWPVSIRHPRHPEGEAGSLSLCDRALSTSGDYEKYFFFRDRRFSHLIDPRSGYPVSGTTTNNNTTTKTKKTNALSTAAFVLGNEEGKRF